MANRRSAMDPFWLGKGLLLGALTTTVLACGPAGESGRTTAQTAPDPYLEEVAGTYRVEGVTVQSNRGELRDVSGTITLKTEGSGYTAEIALTTLYPTDVAAIPAEIAGHASGRMVGSRLVGTAETHMRPGAGVELSGQGGTPPEDLVVFSSSVATIDEDGRLTIQIQNEPEKGQAYAPSITVLAGLREGTAGVVPAVAAGREEEATESGE